MADSAICDAVYGICFDVLCILPNVVQKAIHIIDDIRIVWLGL